jgi:hypothetical protein
MSITASEAIENAARLLKHREVSHMNTYGGTSAIALELADAWTKLAHEITLAHRDGTETK